MSQKSKNKFWQDFENYIPSLTSFGGEKTARILSLEGKRSDNFLHFVSAPLEVWLAQLWFECVADVVKHNDNWQMNIVERAQLKMEKISRLNMGDYLCVARYHLFSFGCILFIILTWFQQRDSAISKQQILSKGAMWVYTYLHSICLLGYHDVRNSILYDRI